MYFPNFIGQTRPFTSHTRRRFVVPTAPSPPMRPYLVFFFQAAFLVTVTASPQPVKIPMPYMTTMLRTHKFNGGVEFLSIYEQLSVRDGDSEGDVDSAYHIFPGVPFSMRDANDTTVLGIRVVYRFRASEESTETFYYLTDLDHNERCVSHTVRSTPVGEAEYIGNSTLRGGVPVQGYIVKDGKGGSTTTFYTQELRGPPNANGTGITVSYPFRIQVAHPPGGAEYGYVLDHGQHFPVEVSEWFATNHCPPATILQEEVHAGHGGHHHWHHLRDLSSSSTTSSSTRR